MKRKPKAPRGTAPKPITEPGMQPTVAPDTTIRRKWAKAQLARDRALLRAGYAFDPIAADHICSFFERFVVHRQGEWTGPVKLHDWQARFLRRLFGWIRPDGTRRYRKAYLKVGRKNGKSLICSGIGLYLTVFDGENGADVYCAATDETQAEVVFKEAKNMVEQSAALKAGLQVYKSAIVYPKTLSSYKPLSKDSRNKDGLNIHGLICDELHEWTDRDFFDKLTTAQGARRQPLTVVITTAGDDPASIWGEEDQYAHQVADGERAGEPFYADEYLAAIYEAEKDDDWKKESTWIKANPGIGVAPKWDYLRSEFRLALEQPAKEIKFKRYYLNMLTQKFGRWMPMDKWDKCNGEVDVAAVMGKPCWVGLDLSRRTDITAAVAVFRDGEHYLCIPRFWIPEASIHEKERTDKIPIRTWIAQGFVEATPGDVIDYEWVRRCLVQWAQNFDLREVAYDPAGATQLALQLADEDGITCVEHGQSMTKMSEPTKALEAAVRLRRVKHSGNPVLRWMAGNAVEYRDALDNVKLLKNRSAGRIDGVVALIMAMNRATLGETGPSAYETRGIRTV